MKLFIIKTEQNEMEEIALEIYTLNSEINNNEPWQLAGTLKFNYQSENHSTTENETFI